MNLSRLALSVSILGGVFTGFALGLLDCLVQHMQGRLVFRTSFWHWSELLYLVPLFLTLLAAIGRPSVKKALFAAVIPPTFIASSMVGQNIANTVPVDATLLEYVIEVGVTYTIVCAPLPILAGYLSWRFRYRVPEGHCSSCGYDLTGNVSGRCPECGTSIADAARLHGE